MYNVVSSEYIAFEYSPAVLKKSFLESGMNMLDMARNTTGVPDIDEYLRKFPFLENGGELVTDEMWRRLFVVPSRHVDGILRMISPEKYSTAVKTDINDSLGYIRFCIGYNNECNPSDLRSADSAIYDVLVYGALSEWFTTSGIPALSETSAAKMNAALSDLSFSVKKLEFILLREQCLSPIFDDMLVTTDEPDEDIATRM